jgi:protein-histidine pros-kinase
LALFLTATVLQHQALRSGGELTDARKHLRQTGVGMLRVQVQLTHLVGAHEGFLLGDDVPRRMANFRAAEQRLAGALDALQADLRAAPQFSSRAPPLVQFLRDGQQRMADRQGLAEAGTPAPADLDATRQFAAAADRQIDGLLGDLWWAIDDYDRRVPIWQQRADQGSLALTACALLLLLAAYGMLAVEQARRRRAEVALLQSRDHLEQAVHERTAELEASHAQLQALTQMTTSHIEAERTRLAREVHDQLGQILTAAKLHAHHRVRSDPSLAQCVELLDEAIRISRRIAADLRPPLLDELGLAAALKHLVGQTALSARLRVEDDQRLAPRQAEALFRIAQEALTNVQRHAGAEHLHIQGGPPTGNTCWR